MRNLEQTMQGLSPERRKKIEACSARKTSVIVYFARTVR
jgi:hypothetical protein